MKDAHVIKDFLRGSKRRKFRIRIVFDISEIARHTIYFFQRLFRGWSDDQLWELGDVICRFVLPRLHAFIRKGPHGYPADLKDERQWVGYLKEMEWALEMLKKDDWKMWKDKGAMKRLEAGLALCGKYLFTLWD